MKVELNVPGPNRTQGVGTATRLYQRVTFARASPAITWLARTGVAGMLLTIACSAYLAIRIGPSFWFLAFIAAIHVWSALGSMGLLWQGWVPRKKGSDGSSGASRCVLEADANEIRWTNEGSNLAIAWAGVTHFVEKGTAFVIVTGESAMPYVIPKSAFPTMADAEQFASIARASVQRRR